MSFCIDNNKILQNLKTIWTKTEDLLNIELYHLPAYDDKYVKTKIRAYSDKVCANFRGLNVQENDVEFESFIIIAIDSLLVYYPQVHLDNCAYKIVDNQLIYCLDNQLLYLNISHIDIITVKGVDNCCIIYGISKSEAINLLEKFVLDNREYI